MITVVILYVIFLHLRSSTKKSHHPKILCWDLTTWRFYASCRIEQSPQSADLVNGPAHHPQVTCF